MEKVWVDQPKLAVSLYKDKASAKSALSQIGKQPNATTMGGHVFR